MVEEADGSYSPCLYPPIAPYVSRHRWIGLLNFAQALLGLGDFKQNLADGSIADGCGFLTQSALRALRKDPGAAYGESAHCRC